MFKLKSFLMWTGGAFWVLAFVAFAFFVLRPAVLAVGPAFSLTRFLYRCSSRERKIPFKESIKALPCYWWQFFYEESIPQYTMRDGSWWRGLGDWELISCPDACPTEPELFV